MNNDMRKILLLCLLGYSGLLQAQNDRVNDFNYINWVQSIHTIKLDKKWSLHAEYQWRRDHGLKYWQQSLLRLGVNYKLNDQATVHFGYGWIETFPYGDYPTASNGTFPEHRIYEQLVLKQPLNKWTFTHRFRIEQRWVGRRKPNTGNDRQIEGWTFLHRFRYMARGQRTLWSKADRQWFAAIADEIFIGAGKKLGVNIFDQNRLFLLAGYKFSPRFTLEAGYMNQTVQQGKRINNQTIMQRNNGWVLAYYLNL